MDPAIFENVQKTHDGTKEEIIAPFFEFKGQFYTVTLIHDTRLNTYTLNVYQYIPIYNSVFDIIKTYGTESETGPAKQVKPIARRKLKGYFARLEPEQVEFLRNKQGASEYLRTLIAEAIIKDRLATARPGEKIILLNAQIDTIKATIEKLNRNPTFLKSRWTEDKIFIVDRKAWGDKITGPLSVKEAIADLSKNFDEIIRLSLTALNFRETQLKAVFNSPGKLFFCCLFARGSKTDIYNINDGVIEIGLFTAGTGPYSPETVKTVGPEKVEERGALATYLTKAVASLEKDFETDNRVFVAYTKEVEFWETRIKEIQTEIAGIEV